MPPQARLGVVDLSAGREGKRVAGHRVADPAAERDGAGEAPPAEDEVSAPAAHLVGDTEDVVDSVLTVAVGTDHIRSGEGLHHMDEAGPQRGALASVDLVREHGRAGAGHGGEERRELGAAPVVDHDDRDGGR